MSKNKVAAAGIVMTITEEEIAFRERMHRAGIPGLLVSMYARQLRKVEENEREACAKVCEELPPVGPFKDLQVATVSDAATAIRAR